MQHAGLVTLGTWNLPGPGIKPVSPALAGGFLSTVPPGKSLKSTTQCELGIVYIKNVSVLSRVRLSVTPWTIYIAHPAPPSMGFSRQEYWSGVAMSFFLQGIFPTQGSNPGLPHCRQALYPLSHQGSPMLCR